jgi:dihydrofolate reductase
MRRIRYAVAASLDAFIAGPNGEADWILMDPEIDFDEIFSQFDTILVGRATFQAAGGGGPSFGMKTFVFSNSLRQSDYPKVNIVSGDPRELLTKLRQEPGKDIWLFGGGQLFRSLLQWGLVDSVEVAIIPVLLGAGIPLLPEIGQRTNLSLVGQRIYKSGIVSLEYAVQSQPKGRKASRSR